MRFNRGEIFNTLGYVGGALLLAGYLRYSIQETLSLASKILLIGGGVLVVVSLAVNFRAVIGFFSKRSARLGTNTAVMTAAVLVILGLANFLGYRHHKRFDLTSEKLYTLSDQTRRLVGSLQKDVRIVRFAKNPDPDLRDRMIEYENLSHRLHYEQVDPQEKPEAAKQFGVTRMGEVIVTTGARTEHLNDTTEQDITNAILKVTRDEVKTLCFVEGHGEKSTSSTDPSGYSAAENELTKEDYKVQSVNLVSAGGVPAACSVLVVGGPTKAYFPQEVSMIGKYLDAGGKALLLVDPDTDPKLDEVFQAWNIAVGKNTVVDVSGMGRLFGTGPAVPLVVDYGIHPITKNFERYMTFFPLARTVAIADHSRAGPQATELLKTSPASWAAANISGKTVAFNPKTDQKGPLSLGVAADRKAGGKEARLVVIGNSNFAANRWVNLQRNGDLFFNTINWLSQDEDLISVRPKSPANRQVVLTESQQRMLWLGSVIFLPGLVIVCGAVIWWKRR